VIFSYSKFPNKTELAEILERRVLIIVETGKQFMNVTEALPGPPRARSRLERWAQSSFRPTGLSSLQIPLYCGLQLRKFV